MRFVFLICIPPFYFCPWSLNVRRAARLSVKLSPGPPDSSILGRSGTSADLSPDSHRLTGTIRAADNALHEPPIATAWVWSSLCDGLSCRLTRSIDATIICLMESINPAGSRNEEGRSWIVGGRSLRQRSVCFVGFASLAVREIVTRELDAGRSSSLRRHGSAFHSCQYKKRPLSTSEHPVFSTPEDLLNPLLTLPTNLPSCFKGFKGSLPLRCIPPLRGRPCRTRR